MLYDVVWCYMVLYDVIWCHMMLYMMLYDVIYDVIWCYMGCATNSLLNYCMLKMIVACIDTIEAAPASDGRLIGDQSPYGWIISKNWWIYTYTLPYVVIDSSVKRPNVKSSLSVLNNRQKEYPTERKIRFLVRVNPHRPDIFSTNYHGFRQ